nr:hypothetical protein [uncultured Undibacterium sp.]
MKALTKEIAIELGGKVWAKDGKELRVYLNKDAVLKMVEGYQVLAHEIKSVEKAKTYFDLTKNELFSDVGAVRSLLINAEWDCKK